MVEGWNARYKTIQVYTKSTHCIQNIHDIDIYKYQKQDLSQYKSYMEYKTGSLQTMG